MKPAPVQFAPGIFFDSTFSDADFVIGSGGGVGVSSIWMLRACLEKVQWELGLE